jgi:hypothetical protein
MSAKIKPSDKSHRSGEKTSAPHDKPNPRVVLNAYTMKLETLLAATLPREEACKQLLDELHALGNLLRGEETLRQSAIGNRQSAIPR